MRNEIIATASGAIAMDFDQAGMLLGVEVLGATKLLDREFLARAERIDQQ